MKGNLELDKDLLRRFFNYEEAAFNAIYIKYEKGIYRYILKKLNSKNKNEAKDVAQETFIALIQIRTKGLKKPYDNNYLRRFLYQVARKKAINCINKNGDMIDIEEGEHTFIVTEETDATLHMKNLLQKIDIYIDTLEESLRDVALLLSEGCEAEDIAEILEVNRRTIDVRIARFRGKLRNFVLKFSTEDEVSILTKQETDEKKSNNSPNNRLKALIRRIVFWQIICEMIK